MLVKVIGGIAIALVVFLLYVSAQEGRFKYERRGVIAASKEQIFPYISQFRLGEKWSPYEKMDPQMKKTFGGVDGQPGATMEFVGANKDAGSGRLEILSLVPNESVAIKLTMTEPFRAENLVEYKLTPDEGGTRFTWAMSGDGGFMGKLLNVFIDCEKMVADQFSVGIANLKNLVESEAR